jgi:hypothetical protein
MFGAVLQEAIPEAVPNPYTPLDEAPPDPPFDADSRVDETGEAVPMIDLEAEAGGNESQTDGESPLSFDQLLAIDTSKIVESWDDRSSAT